jgi:hypothetical protein
VVIGRFQLFGKLDRDMLSVLLELDHVVVDVH